MKVTTKITERDKKLLVFLVVFAILVIAVAAGILPLYEKIDNLNVEIAATEKQKSVMDKKIKADSENESKYAALTDKFAETSKDYYDLMESQQIDKTITSKVLGCGVEIQNMTITEQADPVEIPAYGSMTAEEAEAKASEDAAAKEDKEGDDAEKSLDEIYAATVDIEVKGDKGQIQTLIDQLANDAGMRIMTIDYNDDSKSEGAAGTTASIGLELYMCEKD